MGNSTAAQVCCCERRPDPRHRSRPLGDGETPMSTRLKGAKQESKSSSSSWPFDFESNEVGDLTKKPLAEQAADQAEGKVKILESSALKVMGKLRKFPTSGMGWGSGWSAKERFFAVLPAKAYLKQSRKSEKFEFVYEIDKAGGSSPRGPRSIDRLRCWRSGSLQYWDTTTAFEKKEPPKGSIPLLGITRVYIDEQNKNEVIVKYANGASSEPVLLRLHFPSQMAAEQWRQEMRQVRATL